MPRLLICVLLAGCATTNYDFPTDQARRCFVPCKSMYYSCSARCSTYHDHHHHGRPDKADAVLGLLGAALSVGCEASCASELDRCAGSCGATNVNRPRPATRTLPSTPMPKTRTLKGTVRQEVIEAQGGQARSEKHCAVLRERIEQLARNTRAGKPPTNCPSADDFIVRCRRLIPAVAQCLNPGVMRRAPERCRGWMKREDPSVAEVMNETLRSCYPKTDDAETETPPTSRPTSQPTSQPVSPPAPQQDDIEEPG